MAEYGSMNYKLITTSDLQAEIEGRIRAAEAQHFAASTSVEEFEMLGEDYALFLAQEKEKASELERLLDFLYAKLESLVGTGQSG